jgi:hypothetical protein
MKNATDLIPWKTTHLALRPYEDLWSFNPSIHFDGATWRCVLRCADYCMPDGKTVRSKSASPLGQQTKNAMVILDPSSWKPIQIFKMREQDGLARATTPHVGFEDMRLFQTHEGGLQGVAASLHLKREVKAGSPQNQPPEQVVLSFDESYNIVRAHPIRSGANGPQKNWVPFDRADVPRFLYSIGKGTLFGSDGPLHGDAASVTVSTVEVLPPLALPEPPQPAPVIEPPRPPPATRVGSRRPSMIRGGDVRIVRGGRMKIDTQASRPSMKQHVSRHGLQGNDSTRLMGGGRVLMPKYEGLRGGTQLVRISHDTWLGIGHEMKFVNSKKLYWHTWYTVNSRGKLLSVSEPMKLVPNGIEFAAGMAIEGDRVVVSLGVDDMESWLGETQLSAVLTILRPIGA